MKVLKDGFEITMEEIQELKSIRLHNTMAERLVKYTDQILNKYIVNKDKKNSRFKVVYQGMSGEHSIEVNNFFVSC